MNGSRNPWWENYFRGYANEMGVPWDALWNLGHIYAEEADHLNMDRCWPCNSPASETASAACTATYLGACGWTCGGDSSSAKSRWVTSPTGYTSPPGWNERMRHDIEDSCGLSVHQALIDDNDWDLPWKPLTTADCGIRT